MRFFGKATEALVADRPADAVTMLEAMGDRGVVGRLDLVFKRPGGRSFNVGVGFGPRLVGVSAGGVW